MMYIDTSYCEWDMEGLGHRLSRSTCTTSVELLSAGQYRGQDYDNPHNILTPVDGRSYLPTPALLRALFTVS